MDDHQFRQILVHFGLSWQGYRRVRKGVKKRIRRHMQELGCRTLEQYFQALEENEELRVQCKCLMTVSISRFFRDVRLWEALENKILPGIIQKNREIIRVWFAGCGCGEEVFSFNILMDRLQALFQALPGLEVLATDMNMVYLKKAQLGVFSTSSLREIPYDVRQKYFIRQKGELCGIIPLLKMGVSWGLHNLLHDPPAGGFHLIFLRNNLLTYYVDEIKRPAFQKVVARLVPEGFLVIGCHESLPVQASNLLPLGSLPYVFQDRNRV